MHEAASSGYPVDDTHVRSHRGLGMATADQRNALLAITCTWCHAAPGEFCTRPDGHNTRDSQDGLRRRSGLPISTLDGGCHDARWQAAGLGTAPVLTAVVDSLRQAPVPGGGRPRSRTPDRSPAVPVGGGERPW